MHQMMPSSKTHLTMFTLEWFFAFMNQRMCLELIRIAELGRTEFARVRTFTRMYTQVTTEIGYLDELTIAMAAVIRFLTGMQSHVRLQVMISSKSVIKWFKYMLRCMRFIFCSFCLSFWNFFSPLNFCILSFSHLL